MNVASQNQAFPMSTGNQRAETEAADKTAARRDLSKLDWDFSGVPDDELYACRLYEYARESPSIVAHCDMGDRLECEVTGKLCYCAVIGERLVTVPNPMMWPWFIGGTNKFEETPWQHLPENYRACVKKLFAAVRLDIPPAFTSADSFNMAGGIISRGDKRAGIDWKKGMERIAVEINWAGYDDREIVNAFKTWVAQNRPSESNRREFQKRVPKGYPPNIGTSARRGHSELNEARYSLERLGIFRLRRCRTFEEMRDILDRAYPKKHRGKPEWCHHDKFEVLSECNREFKAAINDFHKLFPFLPADEMAEDQTPYAAG